MSTDTKIKTLIFNKLTQEQYNNADKVPTEFYLTPDTSIDSSEKGVANGVASLDTNGKVPTGQIPTATTSTLGGVKPDGDTITVTEDGTISAAISGEVVATKAELQDRVAKAGDTMTGTLKMSGQNEVRFGTDDNFYYIKKDSIGNLALYGNNTKGLYLANEVANHHPYYFDGTKGYRLLTTEDLQNIDYVVESYSDDSGNWYRLYKSGWVEQGGYTTNNIKTITLNKPFANTNYVVFGNIISNSTDVAYNGQVNILEKTTTTFSFPATTSSKRHWFAVGQGAN